MRHMFLGVFLVTSLLGFASFPHLEMLEKRLGKDFQAQFLYEGDQIVTVRKGRTQIPASLVKIFTAVAAENHLGADFRFTTRVSFDRDLDSPGTIRNLSLLANGDLEFDIDQFAERLKLQGVNIVEGDILIEDTIERARPLDMSTYRDSAKCYRSLPNALNLSYNCVSVRANRKGVRLLDQDLEAKIVYSTKLGSKWNGMSANFRWLRSKKGFRYHLGARLKNLKSDFNQEIAVPDTTHWITTKIKRISREQGIQWVEKLRGTGFNRVKKESLVLHSKQLQHFTCEMLTHSRNLYAEGIMDLISGSQKRLFYSRFQSSHFVDASGMSRKNSLAAQELFHFLQEIRSSKHFTFFEKCLPKPGQAGTLETRLTKMNHPVMAKTGSLSGISNIAGYIFVDGKWRAFVFMLADKGTSLSGLRRAQDEFLRRYFQKVGQNP